MNGVHCQTSEASTAISGMSESQSGWAGVVAEEPPGQDPLNSPYSGL